MANNSEISETEKLVQAVMADKNIQAAKKLESILKRKTAERISQVLDNA